MKLKILMVGFVTATVTVDIGFDFNYNIHDATCNCNFTLQTVRRNSKTVTLYV